MSNIVKDPNITQATGILETSPSEFYSVIYDINLINNITNYVKFKIQSLSNQSNLDITKDLINGDRLIVYSKSGWVVIKITEKMVIGTSSSPVNSPISSPIGSPFTTYDIVEFTGVVEIGKKQWLKNGNTVNVSPTIENLYVNNPPINLFASKIVRDNGSTMGTSRISWKDGTNHNDSLIYNLRYKKLRDQNWIYKTNINVLTYNLNGLMYNEIYEIGVMSVFKDGTFSYYSESFILYP